VFHFKNLDLSYLDKPVIKGIKLDISSGEKIALIGPSGAGKSTLLKHLHQISPVKVSFIHQNYCLTNQLSVFHNVYSGRLDEVSWFLNLRNLVRPHPGKLEEIRQVLRLLGLEEYLRTKAGMLSGGQQQRTAIARALYRSSDLILGDEPLSALDRLLADEIAQLLFNSAQTVILAIHSVQFALSHAERIIAIKEGTVFFDQPAALVTEENLSRLYQPC